MPDALRLLVTKSRKVLLELADLDSGDCMRFRENYGTWFLHDETDADLLALRDQVREVWKFGPETYAILWKWAQWRRPRDSSDARRKALIFTLRKGGPDVAMPNFFNLRLALMLAVLDMAPKLACCANPDCPQPHFLKDRKNQQFCDRPTCVAWGLRQRKLAWWRKHGEEWRRKKSKRLNKATRKTKRRT